MHVDKLNRQWTQREAGSRLLGPGQQPRKDGRKTGQAGRSRSRNKRQKGTKQLRERGNQGTSAIIEVEMGYGDEYG